MEGQKTIPYKEAKHVLSRILCAWFRDRYETTKVEKSKD